MGTAGRTCLVMNDCTRPSHSFWRSDILKSIGRSLLTVLELLAALSPRRLDTARSFRGRNGCNDGAVKARKAKARSRGLTIPTLQTIVSYKCLKCNRVSHAVGSDPHRD